MNVKDVFRCVDFATILSLGITFFCLVRNQSRFKHIAFGVYVVLSFLQELVWSSVAYFWKELGITAYTAFKICWSAGWIGFFLTAFITGVAIYSAYHEAMRPFDGLKRVGRLIFFWMVAVSFLFTFFAGAVPGRGTDEYWQLLVQRIQQSYGILTLCVLLFVCFAIRPLGLTMRSRKFGILLGIGVVQCGQMIDAAWSSGAGARFAFAPVHLTTHIATLLAASIWLTYFALPEPERRWVLLPTTSPYWYWNAICEAMNAKPGNVLIDGFHPDDVDPAEYKMMLDAMAWPKRLDENLEENFRTSVVRDEPMYERQAA